MKVPQKSIEKLPISDWIKALSEGTPINQNFTRSKKASRKEFRERKTVRSNSQ